MVVARSAQPLIGVWPICPARCPSERTPRSAPDCGQFPVSRRQSAFLRASETWSLTGRLRQTPLVCARGENGCHWLCQCSVGVVTRTNRNRRCSGTGVVSASRRRYGFKIATERTPVPLWTSITAFAPPLTRADRSARRRWSDTRITTTTQQHERSSQAIGPGLDR